MKLESEKAGVILGFIGVSWVSRGTLAGIAEGRPGLEQARKVDGFGL